MQAPPLFIQEKVHPKVLVDDLLKRTHDDERRKEESQAPLLFQDLYADFNGLPDTDAKTEFYQHDANWTNRMILGDSLQVMASLAEREGLRGKVQCIYIDPPYGIKFNSNFQWSTTSRDVKDGNVGHITREPEQVKAFRDTWRDGIHSYLTYLRDRFTVTRDLLTETGSVFVQIGDENVHRIRAVLDEVFGETNFISEIAFKKTSATASDQMDGIFDILLWYAKNKSQHKFRQLYEEKGAGGFIPSAYNRAMSDDGQTRSATRQERQSGAVDSGQLYSLDNLTSSRPAGEGDLTRFLFHGRTYTPGKGTFKTDQNGMQRLGLASRLEATAQRIGYIRFLLDFPAVPTANFWTDTVSSFMPDKVYVVQTVRKIIERCILMSTDPGDLVLDPTCGSGTTAYVAEQWGRRWITIDTSRVALALARARIMGARYPYYLLSDSKDGQFKEAEVTHSSPSETHTHGNIRQGFVYERVPHITLKSIANNAEIDVIWEQYEQKLAPLRGELSVASGLKKTLEEWEVPRERTKDWPPATQPLLTAFWKTRIARQKAIDASIAAKADYEYLYDKPYEDKKKVRVAGPFTVESLSPHRVLTVDADDELVDSGECLVAGEDSSHKSLATNDFPAMILENLKTAGVQQAHKEDKITFSSIAPWPGRYICAEGRYEVTSGEWLVASGEKKKTQATSHKPPSTLRAGIFIGPEFGTVTRQDLVVAAREAGDADFDLVIACAFNYEAHASEFTKLGRIPVLKARMNADLHMADDLKNTGKGNLFVIFGEPDIEVVSGEWLVASNGRMVAHYGSVKELSGVDGLAEINQLGGEDLRGFQELSVGRTVRADQSDSAGGSVGSVQHRGGSGADGDRGVSSVPERGERVAGRGGDAANSGASHEDALGNRARDAHAGSGRAGSNAKRAKTLAAIQTLTPGDFPLSLTTKHYSQVTILGVDVFKPQTGEVESSEPDDIACWFIDTDYNEESFFVRHAYFLGANDPYKSLKTTLKAEINEDAWATLNSDTSRPFDKPESGRIAVKVINHLGDEVMKVFRVE